jgi:hypothetical protein
MRMRAARSGEVDFGMEVDIRNLVLSAAYDFTVSISFTINLSTVIPSASAR